MRPILKSLSASIAVVAVGAGLAAATATPAAADPGAIIAGVIGGAALGAIVAGAASQNHYNPGYYQPRDYAPAYQPQPAYQYGAGYARADDDDYAPAPRQRCVIRQQPMQDQWGRVVDYQPVRVCR